MGKKRILNITSTKKRNGMLAWSNTTGTGASQPIALSPAYVPASTGALFMFSPTKQSLVTAGVTNQLIDQSDRTSTTCYMKGFSEHIRIQTSSALPWFWRRICFTGKGPLFAQSPTPINPEATYADTSNGMERLWLNLSINNSPDYFNSITSLLFKGVSQKDWTDPLIAPLDTSRISVKYDKTQTFKSGNSVGTVAERKMWHPMNKNLVYDDDENGAATTTSYSSVQSKAGMGDYYIVDIFTSGSGGAASDIIRVDSNSTLYWHEK